MRVYVIITSMCPLKIYLYNEGLVRFSTDKYSLKSLDNKFAHLTNTSINKYAPNLNSKKGVIGPGCKWSFEHLKDYFRKHNMDYDALWFKIKMIVILTLVQFSSSVQNYECCFELLGFDIFVDKKQKPWLLEVNTPPALAIDGPLDEQIKPQLIKDILEILDFEKYEDYNSKIEYESVVKKQKQQYFFKKRFKSQRNTSVTSESYGKSSNLSKASVLGSNPLSSQNSGNGNNSLLVHHERININNPGSNQSANFILASKSPTAIDINHIPIRVGSKAITNFNHKETNQYYSNLSQKPKSYVRKTQQNISASSLRPAPYFKYSMKHSNTAEVKVSFKLLILQRLI
jgi:hypothetical protein